MGHCLLPVPWSILVSRLLGRICSAVLASCARWMACSLRTTYCSLPPFHFRCVSYHLPLVNSLCIRPTTTTERATRCSNSTFRDQKPNSDKLLLCNLRSHRPLPNLRTSLSVPPTLLPLRVVTRGKPASRRKPMPPARSAGLPAKRNTTRLSRSIDAATRIRPSRSAAMPSTRRWRRRKSAHAVP